MPNAYILLGANNARKSSTIRALTGAGKTQPNWAIVVNNITEQFYVEHQSLQEKGISAVDFSKQVGSRNNVILSLRLNGIKKQDDAIDYINDFLRASWNIRDLVILDAGVVRSPASYQFMQQALPVTPLLITGTINRASNSIASQLRTRWNWL